MKENLRVQQYAIQFCFKLKKTQTETFSMIREVYGESAVSCSTCYTWYMKFKDGRTSVVLKGETRRSNYKVGGGNDQY